MELTDAMQLSAWADKQRDFSNSSPTHVMLRLRFNVLNKQYNQPFFTTGSLGPGKKIYYISTYSSSLSSTRRYWGYKRHKFAAAKVLSASNLRRSMRWFQSQKQRSKLKFKRMASSNTSMPRFKVHHILQGCPRREVLLSL